MLEALGLSGDQQRIYELVLARPSWTLPELATAAQCELPQAEQVLRVLDRRGLVTNVAGCPTRWKRVPPDAAIESYITQHHQRLRRVRALIPTLMTIYNQANGDPDAHGPTQMLSGRAAICECWDRLQRAARLEVCQFEKPPYVAGEANDVAKSVMRSGVVYRTVYDEFYLDNDFIIDDLRARGAQGERVRVLPSLPTKIGLVDRRWALLPVSVGKETDSALLVSSSALLLGLISLFEASWQRAVPLSTRNSQGQQGAADLDGRVLKLLAAGLTDKNIAHHLGISLRTAQRHVRALMDLLGAQSRFQAGVRATQLGMLDGGDDVQVAARTRPVS
ncbi:helix-turn-helix transcriptional regulator [Amycolatopsis anabasis]|uniref:helix-turn-helix transcriptional regulator n=1 Tax=Amycolatopsis anabasis TaxID=1840409 RepID=UPI00131C843E|nr:LuxR family transcriptional regulator [Amycolatopsis anabasis]